MKRALIRTNIGNLFFSRVSKNLRWNRFHHLPEGRTFTCFVLTTSTPSVLDIENIEILKLYIYWSKLREIKLTLRYISWWDCLITSFHHLPEGRTYTCFVITSSTPMDKLLNKCYWHLYWNIESLNCSNSRLKLILSWY